MIKIGLISDTHGYLDEQVFTYFKHCDEIWHGGDIGTMKVLEDLEQFKPTVAVFGNIDNNLIQAATKEDVWMDREGMKIFMTHIGGKPPTYNPRVRKVIEAEKPDVFVCGHSHILRVMTDPKRPPLLYLNPGAAGKHGFHQMRTLLRFSIDDRKISEMQVIELGSRTKNKHIANNN